MRNVTIASILGSLVSVCNVNNIAAQQVCDMMASKLQQDVLLQGTDRQTYEIFQKRISDKDYEDFKKAQQSTLGLGINVPQYVDAVLNTKSDESTWKGNRHEFLETKFDQLASEQKQRFIQFNAPTAAMAEINRCAQIFADSQGFFANLAEVVQGRDRFQIHLIKKSGGNGGFQIRDFSVVPANGATKCYPEIRSATEQHPYQVKGNALIVNCQKDPNLSVSITANTTEGPAGPFAVGSVNDQWAMIRERLEFLEANIVPGGVVAFFMRPSCPQGWQDDEKYQGRYLVGIHSDQIEQLGKPVGEALKPGESRPAGQHTHEMTGYELSGSGDQIQYNPPRVQRGGEPYHPLMTKGLSSTTLKLLKDKQQVPEGTNAPYVPLLACRKL